MEDVARKFEAAWAVFARTCSEAVAPEATFQAWFAHYLISQFGIDRVAREPAFGHREVASRWRSSVPGGELRVDAVVLREPGVSLGLYLHRSEDPTGMSTLAELSVISELKIASSSGGVLDHREVAQDIYELSLLLDLSQSIAPVPPLAYMCILNNGPRPYRWTHLERRLSDTVPHPDVRIVAKDAAAAELNDCPIVLSMLRS